MIGFLKDTLSLWHYASSRLINPIDNNELVLVYHSVGSIDRQNDPYKTNVTPGLFKKQIEFLSSLKKKEIILTFDDGFENIYDVVFSLVLKYNMKTILFVTVGFIEGAISFDSFFKRRVDIKPLSWRQLKEMASCGLEIGSHTLTHPNLVELDNKEAYAEIADSKKKLEDKIGKEVKSFAYPYGAKNTFDNRIKEIVRDAGYKKAYTNIMGFNTENCDFYELKRMRIYSDDNIFRFKLKTGGAYNWVDAFAKFSFKETRL